MCIKGYVSYTGIQRMIPYNILQEVDMDSHRYGSYYSNVYEFPFPEMPILKEERIAYVKANPDKYMPLPLRNKLNELDKKMDLILSKLPK